jgi:hypothetical protein
MKPLAVLLVIACLCLLFIGWRLFALDETLRGYVENAQLIVRSNQDLIQQNIRLEQALVTLQRQVESFKDSMPKR